MGEVVWLRRGRKRWNWTRRNFCCGPTDTNQRYSKRSSLAGPKKQPGLDAFCNICSEADIHIASHRSYRWHSLCCKKTKTYCSCSRSVVLPYLARFHQQVPPVEFAVHLNLKLLFVLPNCNNLLSIVDGWWLWFTPWRLWFARWWFWLSRSGWFWFWFLPLWGFWLSSTFRDDDQGNEEEEQESEFHAELVEINCVLTMLWNCGGLLIWYTTSQGVHWSLICFTFSKAHVFCSDHHKSALIYTSRMKAMFTLILHKHKLGFLGLYVQGVPEKS